MAGRVPFAAGSSDIAAAVGNPNVQRSFESFGAVGNGVVDDTAALTAAIQWALATNNQRPRQLTGSGVYLVTSTITAISNRGLMLVGSSMTRSTRIDYTGSGPLLDIGADTSTSRTDGAITAASAVLTGSGFTVGDVGKSINVNGAGPAGAPLSTTIAAFTSATQVTLAATATTTVGPTATYTLQPYEASLYDGIQSIYLRDITLAVPASARDTALANGLGNYKTGTYAIRDWRGGDVRLTNVAISNYDYAFWGVQSDIDNWTDVQIVQCHSGIYAGPRSDQFTFDHCYMLQCDRIADLDRVSGMRFRDCQFVDSGTDTINPIRIRSSWSTGSHGVFFDDCWFENFNGYATAAVEAFIEVGVGDLVTSDDVHITNPTIMTNATGTLPRTKHLIKAGNADALSIVNPNGRFWKNLDQLAKFVGTTNPSLLMSARNAASAAAFATLNSGSGTPSVTTIQWSGAGAAGAANFGSATLTFGQAVAAAVAHIFGASGNAGTDVAVRAAAGNARSVTFQSGTSNRWIARANSTAESGSNVGSDFELSARDDSGASIGLALQIVRATLKATLNGDVAIGVAGKGLQVKEGTNAKMGVATLVAGTVTVSTTAVGANSRIFTSAQNSSGVAGELTIANRVAGTSFDIVSLNAADTRTVAWMIVEPA